MSLRVVGAGLGRTGTASLQQALQRLLDAPCYHMIEVFGHLDEHVPVWHAAARDEAVDWDALFDGYAAAVDWPAGSYWQELSAAYPDALVLLSTRLTADEWWNSANDTIFIGLRERVQPGGENPGGVAWRAMIDDMMANRFTADFLDEDTAKEAYVMHNEAVRRGVPAERLLEWRPGDGWEPICERLGLDVPDEAFPHTNTTAEFRDRMGFDEERGR